MVRPRACRVCDREAGLAGGGRQKRTRRLAKSGTGQARGKDRGPAGRGGRGGLLAAAGTLPGLLVRLSSQVGDTAAQRHATDQAPRRQAGQEATDRAGQARLQLSGGAAGSGAADQGEQGGLKGTVEREADVV